MRLAEFVKKIVFRYSALGAPYYPYKIEPMQLVNILNSLEDVRDVEGNVCEIGVARGMTSRFICEHFVKSDYRTTFYCIDTFNSFTKEDVQFEVSERGKTTSEVAGFTYNDYDVWCRNFKKFPFVKPLKADVNYFDFSEIAPIKYAFLDVDLYRPTKTALNNMLPHVSPRAVIMVDDVSDNNRWDGAYQAFMEFVGETGMEYELLGNKAGVIRTGGAMVAHSTEG